MEKRPIRPFLSGLAQGALNSAPLQTRGTGQGTKQAEVRREQCVLEARGQPNAPYGTVERIGRLISSQILQPT